MTIRIIGGKLDGFEFEWEGVPPNTIAYSQGPNRIMVAAYDYTGKDENGTLLYLERWLAPKKIYFSKKRDPDEWSGDEQREDC